MTMFEVADPDLQLALVHVAADRRAAVTALFALDERLGRIVAGSREPMLAAIRLAWWRERLEQLGSGPVPAEPLLRALADDIMPRGAGGAMLARIVEGWESLPQEGAPGEHGVRGAALFEAIAIVLGGTTSAGVAAAGAGWALVDLAFHDSERARAEAALTAARARLAEAPARWPGRLRPLGMLAMLARHDAAAGLDASRPRGSPRRAARMLAFRMFGR